MSAGERPGGGQGVRDCEALGGVERVVVDARVAVLGHSGSAIALASAYALSAWTREAIYTANASSEQRRRTMDFEPSERCVQFKERLGAFMDEQVYPAEPVYEQQMHESRDAHDHPPVMEELK